jgi:hypothetical protein
MVRGDIVYLFAFDVANEILTSNAENKFPRLCGRFDPRRRKVVPSDFTQYRPLAVTLDWEPAILDGIPLNIHVQAYDAGAVTILMRQAITADSLSSLRRFHRTITSTQEPLERVALRICERVRTELGDALVGPVMTQGPETYTVFCLKELDGETDAERWVASHAREICGLLSDLEPAAVSESQIHEMMQHEMGLERSDRVVIDWDAALIVDLADEPDEVLYALEIANLQLQELKALDTILNQHVDRAYHHFSRQTGVFAFGWGSVLQELRQLRMDSAKLADEVTNITKFIGDWYLARVYLLAKDRFHLDGWRASVDQRLSQLDRIYAALQSEANDRRMLWLELMILGLILIELLLGFLRR